MVAPGQVTVITGASSGIGAALAALYAVRPGAVLGLTGRDRGRLEAIADRCRSLGANVETGLLDTRERDAVAAWLGDFNARHAIDLVIANAGVSAATISGHQVEEGQAIHDVFEVNVNGTLNTLVPLMPLMQGRRSGQIAIVSSLAAFAPLPDAAAYSGSKAALLTYGLALRHSLAPHRVRVSVICPGFVTTPMSRTFRGLKPLEMGADKAAGLIARGLERNQAVIAFPLPMVMLSRMTSLVPEPLLRPAMRLFKV